MARPMRVSKTVGEQVRRHRERKGWTQARLSDELAALGEPMDRVVLTRIEKGTRGVTVDEVLLLALALGVSPAHLMMPRATAPVKLAAEFPAVAGWEALMWLRGASPLLQADGAVEDEEQLRFFYESCPDYESAAQRRHPHVFEVWVIAALAVSYACAPGQEENLRFNLGQIAWRNQLALDQLDSTTTTPGKRG